MNKRIIIGDIAIDVDDNLHKSLNSLADQFYSITSGYISRPKFDYYNSTHPQEKNAYAMALIAYNFSLEVGFE